MPDVGVKVRAGEFEPEISMGVHEVHVGFGPEGTVAGRNVKIMVMNPGLHPDRAWMQALVPYSSPPQVVGFVTQPQGGGPVSVMAYTSNGGQYAACSVPMLVAAAAALQERLPDRKASHLHSFMLHDRLWPFGERHVSVMYGEGQYRVEAKLPRLRAMPLLRQAMGLLGLQDRPGWATPSGYLAATVPMAEDLATYDYRFGQLKEEVARGLILAVRHGNAKPGGLSFRVFGDDMMAALDALAAFPPEPRKELLVWQGPHMMMGSWEAGTRMARLRMTATVTKSWQSLM